MQIRVVADQPWEVPADILVVPLLEPVGFEGVLAEMDNRTDGELSALATMGELRGKRFTGTLVRGGAARATWLMAVVGGEGEYLDREAVVHIAAGAMRRLGGRDVNSVAVWLSPLAELLDGGAEAVAELVARGIVEGSFEPKAMYVDEAEDLPPSLDVLTLVAPGESRATLAAAAERGRVMGEGANLARMLSNRSANDVSPAVLADEARGLAEQHGLWIDVIEPDRAAELGMGLFLAVGKGSDNPPQMIVMRSGGEGELDALGRHLAIVGKGVCFDSGGISIKPSDRMEEMKMDKTGACTVIAALVTVARLAPGLPLLAVAPAVENMPGSHSSRPGDIVRALNGKWVDIINTDAEGRLILADALTYAEQLGATHLVDTATLTGAVGRALGELVSGAFGTPQSFMDDVLVAAHQAGERFWQLPLVDEYRADMESWYGDFTNSSSPEGGLIKSALFLREFVTRPWVHLDIAGTAYYRKTKPFAPRGATGASHATLVELALAGVRPA
ncbi:MAG: M17 family metallopeptidase [Chloroflexota bacterium]